MNLIADLRYALRRLRYSPAFTATAVLTLALGMGATTVVYSVMQAVLINSLPFPRAEQIYVLREAGPHGDFSIAWPNFVDWRSQQHSFEDLAAFNQQHFEYFDGVRSTLPRAGVVTAAFFPLLRGQALLGRTFTEAENKPGAPPVIVLSYAFWQHQLHGEAGALGRTLDLSGNPYTVIGVMPEKFAFFLGNPVDFYLPLGPRASDPGFNNRTAHGSISAIGRLKPGVKPETARVEMEAIAARLAAAYPAANGGHSVAMFNFVENYFSGIVPVLELLMAAVVIVLLVGCANVSNLLLTRGADREREFAIRRALGASRRRIVQQSFAESFWLAALATAAGVLIAYVSLPALLRFAPQIPRLNETAISWPVLAVALGITAIVCLLCGVFPAWNTMRSAPELALRSYSPASSAGRQRQMLRSSLLIAGVAVTVILATGTGLLVRSLRNTLAADPGFAPDHLLNLDIVLTGEKYKKPQAAEAFFTAAVEKLRAVPGVTDAGAVCTPPLEGECGDYFYSIPGQTSPNDADANDANFNIVDKGYFRTAGIRLLAGRSFLPTDTASSPHVTVVNETFARKWWPAGDAIGHTVLFGGRGEKGNLLQIVGIVHDTKQSSLDSAVQPELFFPEAQSPGQAMVLLARTAVDPMLLASAAEQAIQTIDKQVPVRIHPMSYFVERTLQQRRFITLLLTIFAGLAMLLAALGIFGVAAYAVTSRRAEIAVRLALGAEPARVKAWIRAQILRRVAAGCAIGIAGSLLSRQIVSRFLYGVSAEDPAVLTGACVALLAVAALAVWLPARRAARIDPMQTLRAE